MLFQVTHEADFGDLPDQWKEWKAFLSQEAVQVYLKLRKPALDGLETDLKKLASRLGLSRNKVLHALRDLEQHSFITYDADADEAPWITVRDVPQLRREMIGYAEELGQPKEMTRTVDAFIRFWARKFEEATGRPFGQPTAPEIKTITRMLKRVSLEEAIQVANYWWSDRDEESTSLLFFYTQYHDTAAALADYERRRA